MKNQATVLAVSLMSCLFAGHVYAESDEKSVLQGTCVEDQQLERPTASKDCIAELTESNSNVFEYYRAVPNSADGEVTSYLLIPNRNKIKLVKPLRGSAEIIIKKTPSNK